METILVLRMLLIVIILVIELTFNQKMTYKLSFKLLLNILDVSSNEEKVGTENAFNRNFFGN